MVLKIPPPDGIIHTVAPHAASVVQVWLTLL